MRLDDATIPLPGGVTLAADLYMPDGAAAGERFPVILEYLPYRKTESRGRNWSMYSYFVKRGYVVARVDIRGTGNSTGRIIPYEYSDIEQQDGEVVIDWLSKQPFANGNVGMFGISWGGFNSIHMAMRNPPALKAFIAIDATDDLYQDDVHFMDGIIHVDSWEMSQDLHNSLPGAPDFRIDEALFKERFDTPPWMLTYKPQQRYNAFWKRTALVERYDSIKVPGFLIGGWYDGYRDSLPRMLEHVKGAPMKAMIGPWSHAFPHEPYPNPGMEWRHEAVRFFDKFLKGRETGIMEEPRFAVYVRDWHPPGPHLDVAPGKWRWEAGWPIARTRPQVMQPQPNHTLAAAAAPAATHRLRYVPTSGIEAGGPVMWFGDVAPDQRPTDALSLVYDSDPVPESLEILGLPVAHLNVSADAPLAHWYVRLSDVAADGTVTQVAAAGFNGAHRHSAENPEALEPGKEFPLDIEMHFTSWVFAKGHRMRFTVANAQWPMLWPTPYKMTTTLRLGGTDPTRVTLPVIPGQPQAPLGRPQFLPPEAAPDMPGYQTLEEPEETSSGYGEVSRIERDIPTRTTTVTAINKSGSQFPWGKELFDEKIVHQLSDDHPEAASAHGTYSLTFELANRRLRFENDVLFKSDLKNFYFISKKRMLQDGTVIREKNYEETIPRDFQ